MTGLALVLGLLTPLVASSTASAVSVNAVTPADGDHVSSIPVLSWPEAPTDSGVRVTSTYRVQIAASASFTAPLIFDKVVAANTATPEVDLAPAQYYWRYAPFDQDGAIGAWSSALTFTRETDAAPQILSPEDSYSFSYPQEPPTLRWSALSGMDSYEVQTAKDSNFTLSVKSTTTTNTALTPTTLLASLDGAGAPQPYYWRVKGNSVSGATATAWSEPRSFTVVFAGTPTPVQPPSGATADEPTFEWSAVPGASQYDLWVAQDLQFTTTIERQTLAGTRYSPTVTYAAGTYYWKVRALDPGGSWGPWSTDRTFSRRWMDAANGGEVARPDNVTLVATGRSASVNKVALTWEPVGGASHYEVQFSSDRFTTFTTCKTPHTVLTPYSTGGVIGVGSLSTCPATNFTGTKNIRVRAMAKRTSGADIWSLFSNEARTGETTPALETYTFTFEAADASDAEGSLTEPATLLAPDDESQDPLPRPPHADAPLMHWRPVLGATTYRIYLYKDVDFVTAAFTGNEYFLTTNTYFIPPASLMDNTAGQSYYWFVLPCSGTDAYCAERNTVVGQEGSYGTFRKAGLPVGGTTDSVGTKPGPLEFSLAWDDQLSTSPAGGGTRHYQGQLSTNPLDDSTITFTTDALTYVIAEESLVPGATYKWRVRAVDGSGIPLAWSAERSFVAPTAPGPTVMAPTTSGATPVLDWTPTAAQKAYDVEVYRGTDPSFPLASKVASPVSTSTPYTRFAIPTWLQSGDYSWRVRTVDSSGKASAWTSREGPSRSGALLTFTVAMPAPTATAPTHGSTVAEPDQVFTWAPVQGAVKYRMEIGRGTPWVPVTGGTVDVVGTSHSPTTRLAAGEYSWRVSSSTGTTGTNVMSSSALTSFTVQTTPGTPGSPAVTLAGTAIGMTWTPPSSGGAPIQGYFVRYKVGSSEWITTTAPGDAGSFTLNNVALASTYTMQVAAQNAIGRGAFTAAKAITTASPPGAPTLLKGTASGTKLTITWSAPSNTGGSAITGYVLGYRVAGTSSWIEVAAPLTRTVVLSDLSASTTYELQVAAANAVGKGPWATQAVAQTGAATTVTPTSPTSPTNPSSPVSSSAKAPGAPGTPTAVAGDARATVTWAPPTSDGGAAITGYTVTSTPGSKTCTATGTSCVVLGLTTGTTYQFVVTARNPAGASAASAMSASVTPGPPVVLLVKAVSKNGKLSVNVNPDKGAGFWKFRVQKQDSAGSWSNAKAYKTKGKKETRTINLKKGVYRVVVESKYGFLGTTSTPLTLVK